MIPIGLFRAIEPAAVVIKGNPQARIWLFDFDNTLAALETEVDWAASRRQLEIFLRGQGIAGAIFDEFPSRNLPLYAALHARLCHHSPLGLELMQQASAIIESHELRGVEHASPLPGAIELLLELRSCGKRIAIVTSNSSRTVTRWFGLHGLNPAVGAVVGRDSMLPLKPSPEMIIKGLELSGGSATDAVFVGDSEADLHGAHRAQLAFFGISAQLEGRNRLASQGAYDIFGSPRELASHLSLLKARPNPLEQRRAD